MDKVKLVNEFRDALMESGLALHGNQRLLDATEALVCRLADEWDLVALASKAGVPSGDVRALYFARVARSPVSLRSVIGILGALGVRMTVSAELEEKK